MNLISSLFFIFISLFIINKSYEMEVMRGNVPGPGAFPLVLAAILIFLSLILIYITVKMKSNNDNKMFFELKYVIITGMIILLSFSYYILFRSLNFFIVTIIYIFIFNILLNLDSLKSIKKISKVLIFSVTVSTIIYSFFAVVLNVPL